MHVSLGLGGLYGQPRWMSCPSYGISCGATSALSDHGRWYPKRLRSRETSKYFRLRRFPGTRRDIELDQALPELHRSTLRATSRAATNSSSTSSIFKNGVSG